MCVLSYSRIGERKYWSIGKLSFIRNVCCNVNVKIREALFITDSQPYSICYVKTVSNNIYGVQAESPVFQHTAAYEEHFTIL